MRIATYCKAQVQVCKENQVFKESFPEGRDEFRTYLSETTWAVFQYSVLNKESYLSDCPSKPCLPHMSVLNVLTACLCCSSDSSDGACFRKCCRVWDELSDASHTLHCEGLCCEGLGQERSHDNWVHHWWECIPVMIWLICLYPDSLTDWFIEPNLINMIIISTVKLKSSPKNNLGFIRQCVWDLCVKV